MVLNDDMLSSCMIVEKCQIWVEYNMNLNLQSASKKLAVEENENLTKIRITNLEDRVARLLEGPLSSFCFLLRSKISSLLFDLINLCNILEVFK